MSDTNPNTISTIRNVPVKQHISANRCAGVCVWVCGCVWAENTGREGCKTLASFSATRFSWEDANTTGMLGCVVLRSSCRQSESDSEVLCVCVLCQPCRAWIGAQWCLVDDDRISDCLVYSLDSSPMCGIPFTSNTATSQRRTPHAVLVYHSASANANVGVSAVKGTCLAAHV